MASDAPLPSSFDGDEDFYSEDRLGKLTRRLREEPLIPLGCALTVWALVGATRSIRRGDHAKTNIMFRRRIYAQGFTLVAMLAGSMYWQKDREKRKEFEGVVAERQRVEKREKWLRELEARDEDEKAFKAMMERRRNAEKEGSNIKKVIGEAKDDVGKRLGESTRQDARAAGQVEQSSVMEKEKEEKGVLQAVKDLIGWK
ncbi:altered inheritance of mitochondria protein 31, mitochondrial [Glonium stellatum]|uniref:Altered inheritance of mitochondria protein 31, mitochondrial n=1 Tax=Glonium stellatum TaxID=574774 RepID=A0A8E2FDA4_9PEZI|nr:altered inheritance of mitochondria protein 31, mitochondrial [Glonium stellatum]